METDLFTVHTGTRLVTDVTDVVAGFCQDRGDGLCHVFAPHATAGVALMELGSGSEQDLEEVVARFLPRDDRYRHQHGSRGHGADHLVPVFVQPSLLLPVLAGQLQLGTWQSVVMVDANVDNTERRLRCSWLPGS